jgi:hypothetical protein
MRRHAPVFALFFLSPLVAEFLSGTTLPIYLLFLIVPLHLLDPGHVTALGIGILWTVFVLGGHVLWSIGTPIALVEESTRSRRLTPWLGRRGLIVTTVLFVLGCVMAFAVTKAEDADDPFSASPAQLGVSGAIVVVLVVVAFLLPHGDRGRATGRAPSPWIVFGATVVAGVGWGFLAGATSLPWWPASVAIALACAVVLAVLVAQWCRLDGWGRWHRLALPAGALATSGWHAFAMDYSKPPVLDIVGRTLYLLAAAGIVWLAVRRIRTTVTGPS